MKLPSISIITPSFNQGNYLEQTILSVLNQNYPKLEYIIIDGGSTDNSIDIIKKYSKQLSYWISEKDHGQSDAINKGLRIATGEVINWINSDDYYEQDALFKVADHFSNPELNVVSGRGRIFKEEKTIGYSKGVDLYLGNLAKTIGWARIDQPETFFRSRVLKTLGDLNSTLNFLMDRDFWIRYLLNYGLNNIQQIDDVLVHFRLHPQSKTISQKQSFQLEHDSWFYAFSKLNSLGKYEQVIKNNFEINEAFQLDSIAPVSVDLAERILNYFLLFRANEFYAQSRKSDFTSISQFINPAFLQVSDIQLINKLIFRNRFIPVSLLKIIRNMKVK